MAQTEFLQGKRLEQFEALQHCLVPRSCHFSPGQREESRQLINQVLQNKPSHVHGQLGAFLHLIDAVSVMYRGRRFRHLSPHHQYRLLHSFFDSPIPLLRKGFWGLNTLAKLGVYGQPALHSAIGYKLKELPHV